MFHKTLFRAAFIAQCYDLKLWVDDPSDLPRMLWTENKFLYFVHLHNKVLQSLDFNIEVPYPIEHLAKAIPEDHPSKEDLLNYLRKSLLDGEIEDWGARIENSLIIHPKQIALGVFEDYVNDFNDYKAIDAPPESIEQYLISQETLEQVYVQMLNIDQLELDQIQSEVEASLQPNYETNQMMADYQQSNQYQDFDVCQQ